MMRFLSVMIALEDSRPLTETVAHLSIQDGNPHEWGLTQDFYATCAIETRVGALCTARDNLKKHWISGRRSRLALLRCSAQCWNLAIPPVSAIFQLPPHRSVYH